MGPEGTNAQNFALAQSTFGFVQTTVARYYTVKQEEDYSYRTGRLCIFHFEG
jgi:hypothetical protein